MRTAQLPHELLNAVEVVANVLLALLPSVVIAAMHTTIMSASMTAYSTAVGPSSLRMKFLSPAINRVAMNFAPKGG